MQGQERPSVEKPTLYDRLGGVYNIATVVDDLIDRVMVDPRLNANPRVDEAHHRVSAAGFKYFVTELACSAAGGPQKYTGRSMGDSHRHLMIPKASGKRSWMTSSRVSIGSKYLSRSGGADRHCREHKGSDRRLSIPGRACDNVGEDRW